MVAPAPLLTTITFDQDSVISSFREVYTHVPHPLCHNFLTLTLTITMARLVPSIVANLSAQSIHCHNSLQNRIQMIGIDFCDILVYMFDDDPHPTHLQLHHHQQRGGITCPQRCLGKQGQPPHSEGNPRIPIPDSANAVAHSPHPVGVSQYFNSMISNYFPSCIPSGHQRPSPNTLPLIRLVRGIVQKRISGISSINNANSRLPTFRYLRYVLMFLF